MTDQQEDFVVDPAFELEMLMEEFMSKEDMRKVFIGKYVICRSMNEGVNAGLLIAADETGCIIQDARRLHFHHPEDRSLSWYEGVARTGLGNESRVSSPELKLITEDYSLTLCSAQAEQNIRNYRTNPQS